MAAEGFELELLRPEAAQSRYKGAIGPDLEGPISFTVAVGDLDDCRRLLENAGVTVMENRSHLRVPPADANGVLLEFVEA